jgi:hypothetical protein
MRLGIVLAATGATVATAWAFAAAQEGFDTRSYRPAEPATQRTVRYFSRNGSTSQQTELLQPTVSRDRPSAVVFNTDGRWDHGPERCISRACSLRPLA